MNKLSRTITGLVMIIFGIILIGVPLFAGEEGFVAWFWGIPILIIGFFILFNKTEDSIEKIKFKKSKIQN